MGRVVSAWGVRSAKTSTGAPYKKKDATPIDSAWMLVGLRWVVRPGVEGSWLGGGVGGVGARVGSLLVDRGWVGDLVGGGGGDGLGCGLVDPACDAVD